MTSSTDSSEYGSSSEETESSVSLSPAKRSKPRKSVRKAKKGKSHKAKKAKSSKHAKTAKTKKSKRKKEKKSRKEQTTDPGGDGSRKEKTTGWGGDDSWSAWTSASWGQRGSGGSRGWKSEKKRCRPWLEVRRNRCRGFESCWSPGSWQGWKQKQGWPKPAAKAQIQHPGAGWGDDRKRRWGQDPAPDAWTDYWQIARQNNENDEWRVQCPAGARDEGIVPVLLTPDEKEIARFVAKAGVTWFRAPEQHVRLDAGTAEQLQISCRDAGVAVGPDAAVARSDLTYILGQDFEVAVHVVLSAPVGLLPIFDPIKAIFPEELGAKRTSRNGDRREEALRKVRKLVLDFATFFDIADLMAEDEEGADSLEAVLAPKSPLTILKHVGPARTFCEWLVKTSHLPPFTERMLWFFVQCVRKMQRTAATTLDTSLKAIKWSYYSLGLKVALEVFASPRLRGAIAQQLSSKSPWDPAPPLRVSEVLQLHSIAEDESVSMIDRCGAVHFLAMLYGRARCSDCRCIHSLVIDKNSQGSWDESFIELSTVHHKTARLDAQRRRLLPIVIPGFGIASKPFGEIFCSVRASAGLPMEILDEPFLPAPSPTGEWTKEPLDSSEITRWLRYLLPRPSGEKPLSSHSLKVTPLSWFSKFGGPREVKRVLGHHSDAATGSDAVHGRDVQSPALREFSVMLSAVRSQKFDPDSTRSGMFLSGWTRESIIKAAALPVEAEAQDSDDGLFGYCTECSVGCIRF
ncbi:unnamed protein product [Symbiodinium sp. CCMP2456]|nr:unnamed protein product [Symbiodinium sp. CCMP2456]